MLYGGGTHVVRRGYTCYTEGVPMLYGGGIHVVRRGYEGSLEKEYGERGEGECKEDCVNSFFLKPTSVLKYNFILMKNNTPISNDLCPGHLYILDS